MAMKKAAPKKVNDPYGYVSGKNANPSVAKSVKTAVASATKKYGTNFVVDVSMDGVVRTKSGASDKAKKAQSSRMTAKAKAKKK
jgi:hypothetical protein